MDNLIGNLRLLSSWHGLYPDLAIAAYVLARRRNNDYIKVAQMVPDPFNPRRTVSRGGPGRDFPSNRTIPTRATARGRPGTRAGHPPQPL